MKKYTDKEEEKIGDKIAEIFKLKRSTEYPDRWVMQHPFGTKTSLGLFRTFRRINEEIGCGNLTFLD